MCSNFQLTAQVATTI